VFIGYGIDGYEGALATIAGSAIALFTNAYFTFQAFRYDASKHPDKAIASLYRGELGKITLVMVLTALSFKFLELQQPLLLLLAMSVMLLTQSLTSVLLVKPLDEKILHALQDKTQIEQLEKFD